MSCVIFLLFISTIKIFSFPQVSASTLYDNGTIVRQDNFKFGHFEEIGHNVRMRATVINTLPAPSIPYCYVHCIETARCRAINTKLDDLTGHYICELLADDLLTNPNGMESGPGWVFHDTGQACPTCKAKRCQILNNAPIECQTFASCKAAVAEGHDNKTMVSLKVSYLPNLLNVSCAEFGGAVWVIFHHDHVGKKHVQGYEPNASYKAFFLYQNAVADIVAFINQSPFCRQYMRFMCRRALLERYGTGYLMDRNKAKMNYFGGGNRNTGGCACYTTQSCTISSFKCNCDAESSTFDVDEGYVEHKQDLPLTGVALGDTGNSDEEIYYEIGPLECTDV